jgi:hypothetical protein
MSERVEMNAAAEERKAKLRQEEVRGLLLNCCWQCCDEGLSCCCQC